MLNPLDDVVRHQKMGEAFGVTSICSAHPLVLEAAMLQASDDGSHVLVEATSNEVDQTGGYTGMRPKDFRDLVFESAARCGLPSARVLLGATISAQTGGGTCPPTKPCSTPTSSLLPTSRLASPKSISIAAFPVPATQRL